MDSDRALQHYAVDRVSPVGGAGADLRGRAARGSCRLRGRSGLGLVFGRRPVFGERLHRQHVRPADDPRAFVRRDLLAVEPGQRDLVLRAVSATGTGDSRQIDRVADSGAAGDRRHRPPGHARAHPVLLDLAARRRLLAGEDRAGTGPAVGTADSGRRQRRPYPPEEHKRI